MALVEKQVEPIPIYNEYVNLSQVKEDLHAIYRDFQPKTHKTFATVPVAYQLRERELVFMDDNAGDERICTKLNGTVRTVAFA